MFAIRLKQLREEAGYSQATLARKLGVGQSTVGMWENGKNKPQNAYLEKMAEIFVVSTDYLLGRSDTRDDTSQQLEPSIGDIDFALSGEIRDLTDDEKQDVLDYVRFKRAQKAKK